ncbi:MAG: ABC transporter substrate-binding protein [Candidatus Hodarchaeota archaeon]
MTRVRIQFLMLMILLTLSQLFAVAQPTQAIKIDYLFSATLIAPASDPVLSQCAQLIANELPKIHIRPNLVFVGWDVLIPRMKGSLTHADYLGGGFDMGLIGQNVSIIPSNLFQCFHSSNIDPAAWPSNYYPNNNATLDGILERTMNTTDFNQRKEWIARALKSIVWDIHPVTGLYQTATPFYIQDNIRGFDAERYRFPKIEEMSFVNGHSAGHGQRNELVIAGISLPQNYNPIISDSWYDRIVSSPVFTGLLERNSTLHFVPGIATQLPYPVAVKNNYIGELSSVDPNTATVWELKLRKDVYWHEGYGYHMNNATHRDILNFDADDVVWHYQTILFNSSTFPNLVHTDYQFVFGTESDKAIIKVDQYTVQFHLQKTYADLFTLFDIVLPQHILDPNYDALGYGLGIRADGTSAPTYTDWAIDDFNLGKRTSGEMYYPATIGTGAYRLYPGAGVDQTVILTRNPYYFKDTDAYWKSLVEDRPDTYIYTWIKNKDTAKHALETGEIDVMDVHYETNKDYSAMKNKPGIKVAKQLDWEYQTLGYNVLNGASGKLANKYVRLAISHLIPRQDIVDNLLGGLGEPSFVPFPVQSPFCPNNLKIIEYNYTKAYEYIDLAGGICVPWDFRSTVRSSSGFDILIFFIAMGGMSTLFLIYRQKKYRKLEKNF